MYSVAVSKVVRSYWLVSPENAAGKLGRSRYRYLPRSDRVQVSLKEIHAIRGPMCEILWKMSGGLLRLRLSGHDVVVHHQNMCNCTRVDDLVLQYAHKVKPQCNEHLVREENIILREGPEE